MLKEKISQVQTAFAELEQKVADPDLHRNQKNAAQVLREHARLQEILEEWRIVEDLGRRIRENSELLESETDKELVELAELESEELEQEQEAHRKSLRILLVPPDPLDGKNIIMEIRAGTGGDEAALFAADLYRMYVRYAEQMSWRTEILESNATEIGGFKEIVFSISGKEVFSNLKFESGVHRVQRVPSTESGGRIHTSAVTVAVLPEAEETDIQIKPEELRIDVFRSSGPGGQSVNTTDSAVRVTHVPSGLVVICQDEKSQLKNKAKALRVLKARLFEQEERKRHDAEATQRRNQIGSGDRSERIRTYNFPQNRLSDHRINLTLYRLEAIIQGDLSEVIEALRMSNVELQLKH